jgi:dihydroneopterin aldolase
LKTAPDFDGDVIHIEGIELLAHIGVPDDERSRPQRLTVNLTFWPMRSGRELNDDITRAVNYAAVCDEVRKLGHGRRDRLIETLADAIASHILATFEIRRVTLELSKYILPDVEFVSVTVTRERSGP